MSDANLSKVVVTGAGGFVGSEVVSRLNAVSEVVACSRKGGVGLNISPELTAGACWKNLLIGSGCVIHAAARAHMPSEVNIQDSYSEFRRVNVDGTLRLARQAAEANVKRFIFISSIGVNGNESTIPFVETDDPKPVGPYAQSKWEAEQGLWEIQRETGMEVVVIRPPLVYGAGAPGNFGKLVKYVEKGVPLPLGSVDNQRTLVSRTNLVDLIVTCISHPAAANQVFLAGDGEDLSTTELLRSVGEAMGRPARLLPVPATLLKAFAAVLGKKMMAQRLLGSLQVDISKAQNLLGWQPPLTVEKGLKQCFDSISYDSGRKS